MTVQTQHPVTGDVSGAVAPRSEAATAALAALARALEEERRIVLAMGEALADQRAGVARDDSVQVESSIEYLGRCMSALHEARGARLALVVGVGGRNDLPLEQLDEVLGHPIPARLDEARRALRIAAADVAREVSINRAVLGRAVEAGESFLQALFSTVVGVAPVYRSGERGDDREGGSGVLLDRKA